DPSGLERRVLEWPLADLGSLGEPYLQGKRASMCRRPAVALSGVPAPARSPALGRSPVPTRGLTLGCGSVPTRGLTLGCGLAPTRGLTLTRGLAPAAQCDRKGSPCSIL
ncbi:MAG: hypothetical protein M1325_02460, partial [Actinobacteria bacterium]|nr:hypothetical protein [Actinomycetota bacterium]